MDAPLIKFCPIMSREICMEKACAWWNHLDEECSILTLATLATIDIGGRER